MKHKVWNGAPYQCPLLFKHEGEEDGQIIGPLFRRTESGDRVPHKTREYKGQQIPMWVTLREAREIAVREGLPLEEC